MSMITEVHMLNIVIPMAGRGKRFSDCGYTTPKPLIQINGLSMIDIVVKNITPTMEHRFIFICQKEHIKQYDLYNKLHKIAKNCIVIDIDGITEGAACTVLKAVDYINNDMPLMVANSDQFVDININSYLKRSKDYDGFIMTMDVNNDKKWSYITHDDNGFVNLVKEKEPISNVGTVGIYNYKHGNEFVYYTNRMINKNIRTNGEFYLAPMYNEMIADGKLIKDFNIGNRMHSLGTPDDLNFMKIFNHIR